MEPPSALLSGPYECQHGPGGDTEARILIKVTQLVRDYLVSTTL